MSRTELLYLAPHIVSLILSISILIYSIGRLEANGAHAFSWYMFAQAMIAGGFIFEMISMGFHAKIFWDEIQWVAGTLAVAAIPVFSVQFTDHKIPHPKRFFLASFIVPGIFALIFAAGYGQEFIYKSPVILPSAPFSRLTYDFMPAVYIAAIYSYAVFFWGSYILLKRIAYPHGIYRSQIVMIATGILLPVLSSMIPLAGNSSALHKGVIPLAAALGNVAIAWGLFQFQIFKIAPIARDHVFETLVDPVVIIDKRNLVVDINKSMLDLLGKTANEVIGEPAKKIFDEFPIPIKTFLYASHASTESIYSIGQTEVHFELTVWPLYDKKQKMMARVYIAHDITARKELETELRNLNTNLEKRVEARTQELADAYDTMLEGLARALEFRDKETEGHSRRVTENTLKVARRLGISGDELEAIRSGSILHDIGKISTPDEILHKQGRLTPQERLIVEEHPVMAHKLLSPIKFLEKALDIPYSHHEKWDGTGYPQKLKGEEIPLAARIFAVADVWDALGNDRPYNKAWERDKIIQYFKEQSGKHFDPYIVSIFLELVEKGEI